MGLPEEEKTDDLFKARPKLGPAPAPLAPEKEIKTHEAKEIVVLPAYAAAEVDKLMEASGIAPIPIDRFAAAKRAAEEIVESDPGEDVETKLLEIVERRQNNKKKLIAIALKQTNDEDWLLQGGKPYLEGTGAEKIAPIFGIQIVNWKFLKETGEDEQGKWIRLWYFADGQITAQGRVLYEMKEMLGSAWTRDEFFGKKNGVNRPISEIDMADLQKKARNDLNRNIVVRMVGLRSVTIEELKAAGIDIEKVKGIERGVTATDDEKKLQDELAQLVKKLVGTEPAKIREKVKALTQFTGEGGKLIFKEEIKYLTGKYLAGTLDKARKEYAKEHPEAAAGGVK